MSDIIGFRPNDGGTTKKRIDGLVKASRGRINKSDILRAALDEYLDRTEKSGEFRVGLQEENTPFRTVAVPGGAEIKAGASTADKKPIKKTGARRAS